MAVTDKEVIQAINNASDPRVHLVVLTFPYEKRWRAREVISRMLLEGKLRLIDNRQLCVI